MEDADKEDALLISVTRDGKVYFGSDQTNVDTLTTKVKDRLANKPGKTRLREGGHAGSLRQRGAGGGCRARRRSR